MMSEEKMQQIADDADMIVRGYAFKRSDSLIRVFNLNDGFSAMVMDRDGTMIATNMDCIEQVIVRKIWERDSKYMEMTGNLA